MADAAATLRITCPSCHKAGNAPVRLLGKTVRCSQCGMSFLVQCDGAGRGADGGAGSRRHRPRHPPP